MATRCGDELPLPRNGAAGRARSTTSTNAWALPWRVLFAAVAISCLVPLAWVLEGPALCPLRNYAGLPCPGCGGTRAFACMGHGEWGMAFDLHPFAALLWLASAVVAVGALIRFAWPGVRLPIPSARARTIGLVVFFGAWLGWGLVRLIAAVAA